MLNCPLILLLSHKLIYYLSFCVLYQLDSCISVILTTLFII
nr:MAG TPA: hypothetical protein [Caudoviricetes sp.]